MQVTAEVEGAVTEVRFNEGDRVSPQTVLARIDPERYRLEAERAEASFSSRRPSAAAPRPTWSAARSSSRASSWPSRR